MGNTEDAKDISQEVIIKIYRNFDTGLRAEHAKAWVARITHNACMDELRRRKGKITESLDVPLDDDGPQRQFSDPSDGPEALLLRKELSGMIGDGLAKLSEEHRALVVLRDVQGMTYEEIAEIAEIPIGTVKSRISRGRGQLKKILIGMMEQK